MAVSLKGQGDAFKKTPTFACMESDQGKLNLKLDQKLDSVEEYKFEPIKGY